MCRGEQGVVPSAVVRWSGLRASRRRMARVAMELMEYEPYATIVHSKEKLQQIVGKIYRKDMAVHVAEGYINPKTWSLVSSENETPSIVREALKKWNTARIRKEKGENSPNTW